MRLKILGGLGLGVAVGLAVGPARAVDFTLGLGATAAPDYEGSEDYAILPLWNIRAGDLYDPETFVQLLGPGLTSNFVPSPHWRLGLAGLYRRDYAHVDNERVEEIDSTESALLLGPTFGYDFAAGTETDLSLEVDTLYDVLNGNGGVITPRVRAKTSFSPSLVGEARLSTTWGSDDYNANFFSIDSRDAADSGLNTYDADEGFKDVLLGGVLTWRFAQHWSLSGLATYSRLLGDAADSPIVDDEGNENQFSVGALVNYRF